VAAQEHPFRQGLWFTLHACMTGAVMELLCQDDAGSQGGAGDPAAGPQCTAGHGDEAAAPPAARPSGADAGHAAAAAGRHEARGEAAGAGSGGNPGPAGGRGERSGGVRALAAAPVGDGVHGSGFRGHDGPPDPDRYLELWYNATCRRLLAPQ
jgi:hypothetical protein